MHQPLFATLPVRPVQPLAMRARKPIAFGAFVADPGTRTLLRGGVAVEIGGRAFDLLMILLRSRGEIVTKEDIFRSVWPSTIVAEGNLRFQMTMLRRVLGPERERIKTVNGRGYLFVADAGEESPRTAPAFVLSFRQPFASLMERPL